MNNLNLIISEDEKIISFYIQDILKNIKYEEDNKIIYNLKENKFSDILDEASMISLFSKTKVIIGENFDINKLSDNDTEYLSKYINNINKDVYIILISSKVDGRVKAYKLFKDNFNIITSSDNITDNLFKYIKDLISKTGNDINNINSELTKIFLYKNDNKEILKEDIDLLVSDTIDNVIYEFTNAVLEKDIDKVIKMYNNFKIENVGIDYLLVSLSNVFRQSLIIKLLNQQGKTNLEISKVLGKKEFYIKKMIERLYIYTVDDLCKIINKLFEIDYNYKLGNSNYDELELFLINICK